MENAQLNEEITAKLTKEIGRVWLTCPILAEAIRKGIAVPKNSFNTYDKQNHAYLKVLINQLRQFKPINHPKL